MLEVGKLATQWESWATQYGGDYEIRIFGHRCIAVTSVPELRRMLSLRPHKFKRGFTESDLKWPASQVGIGESMFFQEGEKWGRSKRLISPSLSSHNIEGMLSYIYTVAEGMCTKIESDADAGNVVDVLDTCGRYTHDVIGLTAFGINTESVTKTDGQPCPTLDAMQNVLKTVTKVSMNPICKLQWILLGTMVPWVKVTKNALVVLQNIVQGKIDATRREIIANADNDIVGVDHQVSGGTVEGSLLRKIVRATIDERAGGHGAGGLSSKRMTFSDDEMTQQAKGLFIAGTDTTSLTLSWGFYYLAKYPEMHARCRQEALQAAPHSDGLVSTVEGLAQLVFCKAFLKEVLRIHPPGPALFLRNMGEYKMMNGLVLEKGTAFLTLLRYPCMSDENFTRSKDFVPERWIEAERVEALLGKGARKDETVQHNEAAYMPFGFGPRACPGQDLVRAEGPMAISAMCARFDFAMAPGQPDPPREVTYFTTAPEEVKLIFTRKQA